MDPIVLKTFLVPNYTKLMPENMVPGQKVKKVIFTGFCPPPIYSLFGTGQSSHMKYNRHPFDFYLINFLHIICSSLLPH